MEEDTEQSGAPAASEKRAKPIVATETEVASVLDIGDPVDQIGVQIGVRFLEHFSQQLYSSPNKAFEELVSNAWDAGAQGVFIEIPNDLSSDDASIWVLDDGNSMDASGLHDLWKVAYSPKENAREAYGRPVIGKFGIGKLATYVLADELTFICKASDGVIRVVTMDYRAIDPQQSDLIEDLKLDLRETSMEEVEAFLGVTSSGLAMLERIRTGLNPPANEEGWEDEYRADSAPVPTPTGCWTLVVLTNLKQQGREIKQGIIRRMMQTSLPLGAELSIVLNGELLRSSKLDKEVMKEWVIGPELGLESFTLPPESGMEDDEENEDIPIEYGTDPTPHAILPEIGKVTGTVRVYVDNISGGKSENVGASNGFFVNVRGRVVNHDSAFGEKDLSHSVWARFRMAVRADGLDQHLAVNREQFFRNRSLRIFRAFLRRVFNLARVHYEDVLQSAWAEPGGNLVNSWGTLPLNPLRDVVSSALESSSELPSLFDATGIEDRAAALETWEGETREDVRCILERVDFEESLPDHGIAKYRVADRTLSINSVHPFVQEHSQTGEEKRALRNFALVEFMSDIHALDLGIDPALLEDIQQFRDRMARLVAQVDRHSGAQIAELLITVSTYKEPKAFEIIVGDALDYLGYAVERLGKPGQPEGVARAYPTPTTTGEEVLYSFTYDAKSSRSGRVKTGNVGVAGLARHRNRYEADYALVIAPAFEEGALDEECNANAVTPITAPCLGKLLHLTAMYGAISLNKLREMFAHRTPAAVSDWVDTLEEWLPSVSVLSLDVFFNALKLIEDEIPDAVASGHLAAKCREVSGARITEGDVRALARGLQVIVPELVRVENKDIIISAHPDKVANAVSTQLQKLNEFQPLTLSE